jgi:hypothetical protein
VLADVSAVGPAKGSGFGPEPSSIWVLPEEMVGRISARWQRPSSGQARPAYPRDAYRRQAAVEFTTIWLRSIGFVVSSVTAGLLAKWLLKLRPAFGGQWLPVTAAGILLAIAMLALCVLFRVRRRWPGWLATADAVATVAAGIGFVHAELSRASRILPPLHHPLLLGVLAFTAAGFAAFAVWLLPIPVFPLLIDLGRSRYGSLRHRAATRRYLEGFAVRAREIGAERAGEWRCGSLRTISGRLAWVDDGGEVTDLSAAMIIDDPRSLPPWARSATYSYAPTVRLQTQTGLSELEIAPDLYQQFLGVTLTWGGSRRQW